MLCPGSGAVPSWARRKDDAVVCNWCLQTVTASANAAGVLRIDDHEAVTAKVSYVIVELVAGVVGRVWGNADGRAFGERQHAEDMVRFLREHWPTEVVDGQWVDSAFGLDVFPIVPYQTGQAS